MTVRIDGDQHEETATVPAVTVPATVRLRAIRDQMDAEFDANARQFRSLLVELARCALIPPPRTRQAPPDPEPVVIEPPRADVRVKRGYVRRAVVVSGLALTVLFTALFVRVGYVTSGSMRPSMPVGALVLSVAVPADYVHPGDVITFSDPGHPGSRVTHRVVEVGYMAGHPSFFSTKGDANSSADGWRIPARGRVWKKVLVLPGLGRSLAFLGQPVPRLVLELLPLYVLAGVFLVRVWRRQLAARSAGEYF